jgi:2-isopropylmalate synthase
MPPASSAASEEHYAQAVAATLDVGASVSWFESTVTANGETAVFVGCRVVDEPMRFGVAVHGNPALAVVDAVVSAVNRSNGIARNVREDEAVEA